MVPPRRARPRRRRRADPVTTIHLRPEDVENFAAPAEGGGSAPRLPEPTHTGEPSDDDSLRPGDIVRVLEGPYADFSGSIIMIDARSGAVIVELSMFGRPLKAKLQLSEVTRA